MSKSILIRFGGVAAILAGLLRGFVSFVPRTVPDSTLQILYFLIDVLIVCGMVALFGMNFRETGKSGIFGFVIAIIGIGIIRSGKLITGLNLYPAGALIFSIGLNLFGLSLWKANRIPGWIAACWLLSILAGLIVYLVPAFDFLFPIAGLLFAIGFIGAGIHLCSATHDRLDVAK